MRAGAQGCFGHGTGVFASAVKRCAEECRRYFAGSNSSAACCTIGFGVA